MSRDVIIGLLVVILYCVLLVFSNVRYHQGKAEGYYQAVKECR